MIRLTKRKFYFICINSNTIKMKCEINLNNLQWIIKMTFFSQIIENKHCMTALTQIMS